jgi:hypothetical protein
VAEIPQSRAVKAVQALERRLDRREREAEQLRDDLKLALRLLEAGYDEFSWVTAHELWFQDVAVFLERRRPYLSSRPPRARAPAGE